MEHLAVKEELQQPKADFALQVELQIPAPCFELSFPDAGAAIATIAYLVGRGLALPDTLEPRLCGRCGAWHARRIER